MIKCHMECIYCNNKKLYQLKTGQVKCPTCKKKFSIKKLKQKQNITKCFCDDLSANQTSRLLNLNYLTVKKQYDKIREQIAIYQEEQYENKKIREYDEYVYLEHSKKNIKENIFDAQNFITFRCKDNKVYNLLMPSLHKYKNQFLDNGANEAYFKEFSKFMMLNKISKIQKSENIIQRFWYFFEDSVLKYKGINSNSFFYYLKEIEFKFNYSKDEQQKLLYNLIY